MSSTTAVELPGADPAPPGYPLPLAPLGWSANAFRLVLTGLRQPAFERARHLTLRWAGIVALFAVSHLAVAPRYTSYALVGLVAAAGYVVARVVAITVFERRQAAFEACWLEAQSHRLRQHGFEVSQFSIRLVPHDEPDVCAVDLTSAQDVDRLIRRQSQERAIQPRSRACIEFAYQPWMGGHRAIESVCRQLDEIEFCPVPTSTSQARVWFPEARCGSRTVPARGEEDCSERTIYWFLSGAVRVMPAASASVGSDR